MVILKLIVCKNQIELFVSAGLLAKIEIKKKDGNDRLSITIDRQNMIK